MSFTDHIIAFLQNGGPFIYPIALVLVVGLAITIERWLYLSSAHRTNQKAFSLIKEALKSGDVATISQHAQNNKAPVFDVLQSGIVRISQANRREDVEYAMEETIMEYMLRLEKRTPFIATLANIATLLGLLGTIMGLIAAFSAVASADPAEKANLLSSSISVAMNTTAFGLITAIPLILFHSTLQTKTATIVDSIEMAGIKLLNSLSFSKQADSDRG
ncbi:MULTISPECIES: MotA/TolQ/ExbB proton channel family protein [Shewanella]|uniref:MotA/TolQ/ExbB proton channel family protein n=1 Tax=Shewanella electrodiphila TaxID=934143 RepID=A0ABT0KIY8_9GAMM|nr:MULTISPECIES: MotA/TolQ/ExbB proton channel family protein [Shewanella]MCC4833640.1 MotA/TolQ/ExbB proton channel family protein [Shewanella sp. 10N.7]MCL1043800.1 MotA/TolQ/ExbB proton channel family protein [Shewanella electrodiphila]MDO6613860.1 MotA/TolQ/ExbB proton channel family protein [Shewanella sp. 7_MG-2023]MDO6619126.1 MotA/TolQ/ExbB proton channel family protein [Shewanella sp. 6_MG-2023]MDO6641370.1 MotA/TolQ/ExbB proton channel family protein [Shewanella sp. 5_MG-2023]